MKAVRTRTGAAERFWSLFIERLNNEREAVRKRIEASVDGTSPECGARLRLEVALQALFRFDPEEAKRLLIDEWPGDDTIFPRSVERLDDQRVRGGTARLAHDP